ncbi:MAG: glucohydrolase, partial [Erysipelotrichaceae bacterium]|nr:glucohydrolase [Erysipelotrichaceae bacterium]
NRGHETWQCVNKEYQNINVRKDLNNNRSIYRYYQKLLAIKKTNDAAVYGKTREFDHSNRKIIAYSREYENTTLFVIGNFSKKTVKYVLPEWIGHGEVILNNYDELKKDGLSVELKPYQAMVLEINKVD